MGQFEIDINGKDYLANIYTSQKARLEIYRSS